MTDAAAPASAPQVRVCGNCGRTSPPLEPGKFATPHQCWRCYARQRRGTLNAVPAPPNPLLAELKAAYQRAQTYRPPEADALDRFTTVVRLAYGVGGLSTYDIADATGYRPGQRRGWSPMAIHGRLLPEQRRPRGAVGIGRTPDPKVVAEWTPQIKAAMEEIDAAREQRTEAWQTFLDLLADATRKGRKDRVGLRRIGQELDVAYQELHGWLHPRPEPGRCAGHRTGERGDGQRCRAPARRGHQTCWRHADQEPGGGR